MIPGFVAAAVTAGIKPSGKPDMALVVNTGPEFVAGGGLTGEADPKGCG